MVKDFNLGVKIIGIPTVRDSNGLALSSRNKLLNARGIEIAKQIYLNIKKIRNLDYKYTKDLELYLKKKLISTLALTSLSDPWIEFCVWFTAYNFRIVPFSANSGFVFPINFLN